MSNTALTEDEELRKIKERYAAWFEKTFHKNRKPRKATLEKLKGKEK